MLGVSEVLLRLVELRRSAMKLAEVAGMLRRIDIRLRRDQLLAPAV